MSARRQSEAVKMVKVSVEVRSGAARFRVGIQAPSIREALSLARGSYPHSSEVRAAFPIEPEGLFVREPAASTGMVGPDERAQRKVA